MRSGHGTQGAVTSTDGATGTLGMVYAFCDTFSYEIDTVLYAAADYASLPTTYVSGARDLGEC